MPAHNCDVGSRLGSSYCDKNIRPVLLRSSITVFAYYLCHFHRMLSGESRLRLVEGDEDFAEFMELRLMEGRHG